MSRLTQDGTAEPETEFSGANGDREIFIFPVRLTTSRIGNLTRLIQTLLNLMTMHTYGIAGFASRGAGPSSTHDSYALY